jgi:hypothetical protein
MEIFLLFLAFILIIGLLILGYYRYRFYKFEQRVNEITKKVMSETVIEMEIDYHNNEYFAYDFSDKSFLCKGKDYHELATAFETRFPDKRGAIRKYINCSSIVGMPNHLKMNYDES